MWLSHTVSGSLSQVLRGTDLQANANVLQCLRFRGQVAYRFTICLRCLASLNQSWEEPHGGHCKKAYMKDMTQKMAEPTVTKTRNYIKLYSSPDVPS